MKGIKDRAAVVTGAASGIGLATAELLLEHGARVALADVDPKVEEVASGLGERALGIQADVSDRAAVARLFVAASERFGRVDLVHNNAGIAIAGPPIHEVDPADFDTVMRVNVYGVFNVQAEAVRRMTADGRGGAIVNTASIGGERGFVGGAAYVASKHAVLGLTKVGALETAALGIRINAVAPGRTETGIVASSPDPDRILANRSSAAGPAMARFAAPVEIAEVVVFLCSDAASFVTGTCFTADGGQTAA